jgi:glycosyltransferase involved in cell wall biosynthesis
MSLPKILIVHNRYRNPGGEDTVVDTEAALLRSYGHEVEEYIDFNEPLADASTLQKISSLVWSTDSSRALGAVLQRFQPDIVHCHNTFYKISPSIYWLCARMGIPVVQTLHNFRLGCTNARLSRQGEQCELCIRSS